MDSSLKKETFRYPYVVEGLIGCSFENICLFCVCFMPKCKANLDPIRNKKQLRHWFIIAMADKNMWVREGKYQMQQQSVSALFLEKQLYNVKN